MAFCCEGVGVASSHISRKNAIIAVTKSAKATFQAPPCAAWAATFFFLIMMGCMAWFMASAQSDLFLLHAFVDFREGGAHLVKQHLAAEFDGDLWRRAAQRGDQRNLD